MIKVGGEIFCFLKQSFHFCHSLVFHIHKHLMNNVSINKALQLYFSRKANGQKCKIASTGHYIWPITVATAAPFHPSPVTSFCLPLPSPGPSCQFFLVARM